MTEHSAFERQVAREIEHEVGPPRGVDALAIVRAAKQPKPTWRNRSMFNATRLVAAGAVLAVAGIFVVAGRPTGPSQGAPAVSPTPSSPGPAVYVHGAMSGTACCGNEVETHDAEGNRLTLRGMVGSGTIEMDDPRLSGTYTLTISIDEFPQDGTTQRVEIHWGELIIENADGTWRGDWSSTYDSNAPTETELVQYRFTGEGAYKGLSALLSPTGSTVAGAIFPGSLPPR